MPQVIVFGSGTGGDPGFGTKVDPTRPVSTFDYGKFSELMELITVGIEAEKLGGGADKLPELIKKKIDQTMDNNLNKDSKSNNSKKANNSNGKPAPVHYFYNKSPDKSQKGAASGIIITPSNSKPDTILHDKS